MKTSQIACSKHGKKNSGKRCTFPTYIRVKGKFLPLGTYCIVCNKFDIDKKM